MVQCNQVRIEYNILMRIKHQSLHPLHLSLPLRQSQKPIPKRHCLIHSALPHNASRHRRPINHIRNRQFRHLRLIDKTVDGNHILISRLREEG